MKKITDFIVEKRNIIIILFIFLAIMSIFVSQKVKINYDMTEYLPSDSETRIGMDIMNKEFEEEKSSSMNVMFKNLTEEEKDNIYQNLSTIEGVSSVDYEKGNEKYNSNEYTLYIVNVDDKEDSKTASLVYENINKIYKDYDFYTSGAIAERNMTILPMWIIVLAVAICAIILIIMCESYVEPFLFLFCIGVAVLLNNGSNIFLGTISNITSSISAILQLALSMDYSIMLINRYRQEKAINNDKVTAMKEALHKSFTSISSSSITTIVGLLALMFMSFTIGADLGIVLAKGVLLSLLVIFTCLPALILMFDKLIEKTKKKTPNIKLKKLGNVIYKFRSIGFILLLVIFIGSYLLKGNLGMLYTASEEDEIAKIFKENNQIAIIYNNKDEQNISKHLTELEQNENINEVLAYGNTINENLKYDEFNAKLEKLGLDTNIEDYLLKILYYKYYNSEQETKMTFNEFVNFTKNNVLNNENFATKLDSNTEHNINRLEKFTSNEQMNKKRTYSEIADILEINKNDAYNLFVYYYKDKVNISLTINEFVNFINNDVLTDSNYASSIPKQAQNSLKTISKYIDKNTLNKSMNSNEMSKLFGIDETQVKSLYLYYYSIYGTNNKMTINEFSNFVINNILPDKNYSNMFDANTIQNLKLLQTMSDISKIKQTMNSSNLSNFFGIDEKLVKQVLLLKYSEQDNGTQLSMLELINFIKYLAENTDFINGINLNFIGNIDSSIIGQNKKYTATEIANMLNIDKKQVFKIYALYDYINGNTSNWTSTPYEFTKYIIDNSDNKQISQNIDKNTLATVKKLYGIMENSIKKSTYSYNELAKFVGIDADITKKIYALYASNTQTLQLKPIVFTDFILEHKDDEILSKNINTSTVKNLQLINKIMKNVQANKKYSANELSSLLTLNNEDVKLLYSLYSAKHINSNMNASLKDFVEFTLNNVITNEKYANKFNETQITQLNTINGIMNSVINGTQYAPEEIFAIISRLTDSIDENTVELLYIYYGSENYYQDDWAITLEQFINYVNDDILVDDRFNDFIDDEMRKQVTDAKAEIQDNKNKLVGKNYSRIILNTYFDLESNETYEFLQTMYDNFEDSEFYIIGDSPMSYEMSKSFGNEFEFISILTMLAIFVVVAFTFKSIGIPIILVLIIQSAVYMTMGILGLLGESVYFIAILIVQSILMGATIDYAIVYTTYYIESREKSTIKESIINAYNKSINTILTSSSILIIATFLVGAFASGIVSKICITLAQGVLCSTILILFILPPTIAFFDKFIIKKKKLN